MKKRTFSLLIALALVFGLTACGGSASNDTTKTDDTQTSTSEPATSEDTFDPSSMTLTWASPIINHPVLRCCELGFIDACNELGYKYQIVGSEVVDYNEANASAEAAAAAGSPAVLLWVGDEVAVNGVTTLKNDYGTFVGGPHMYWEEGSCPGLDFCMACDSSAYGVEVANFMAERLEGKTGSIAITQASFTTNEDAAAAAFTARIAELQAEGKLAGVTVLAPALEGADDITESTNVNASIIQANPDLIGAFSTTGSGPVTWSNAARKCGKAAGDLVIVAMDYTTDNLAEVESGYCTAIVAQPLYEEAYQGVYYLDSLLRGESVEYWTLLDAPLVYQGGEGVHDPATYAGILDRVNTEFD